MSSTIKVDRIQSDTGTVNLASNLAFSSAFSMSGPVTLNSPTIATPTINSPTIATPTMTGQAVIPSINLTSGQIVFPATQNPSGNANTLDDYEEGTFTAGLVSTAGGSITLNSTQDLMQYTKIGRLVFISGQIVVASVSSPTGAILLNGLPFTSSNIGELASRAAITVQGDGLASSLDVRGSILGNSSTIQIGKMSGGNISNMAADVTAGVSFFVSGFYLTT